MKKKTYEQPKMEVVEFDQAGIICTSTGSTSTPTLFQDEEEFNF